MMGERRPDDFFSIDQFPSRPLQVLVGRNTDGVLHAPAFQRLVNLWLGEGGVGSKRHFLAQLLLPLDLRQQKFLPALCAVHVAWTQLCRQTIAVSVE